MSWAEVPRRDRFSGRDVTAYRMSADLQPAFSLVCLKTMSSVNDRPPSCATDRRTRSSSDSGLMTLITVPRGGRGAVAMPLHYLFGNARYIPIICYPSISRTGNTALSQLGGAHAAGAKPPRASGKRKIIPEKQNHSFVNASTPIASMNHQAVFPVVRAGITGRSKDRDSEIRITQKYNCRVSPAQT
jgi:hypothetical protein